MQNIATSNLSIININNKTSTNPLVRFSGFPSTKSRFLCVFTLRNPHFRASRAQNRGLCFFGLRNPRFQAFRAQNRGFCALLPFGTPVFGLFEHKIEVFVRFCPLNPPFSGFPSTKSEFLCSSKRGFGMGKRKMAFLQITFHASKI